MALPAEGTADSEAAACAGSSLQRAQSRAQFWAILEVEEEKVSDENLGARFLSHVTHTFGVRDPKVRYSYPLSPRGCPTEYCR